MSGDSLTADIAALKKDVAQIKEAIIGGKINGTATTTGLVDRVTRLERAFIGLTIVLVGLLGITGGGTVLDWIKSL